MSLNLKVFSFLQFLVFISIHHQVHCQSLHIIVIFLIKENLENKAPSPILDLGTSIP
jgi:hypothetical protein